MCDGIWMQEHVNTPSVSNKTDDKNNVGTLKELKALLNSVYISFEETNESYGDSSLNPVSLFSRHDSIAALRLRVDYKIGKIKKVGVHTHKDENLSSLIELLLLLSIALKRKGA